MISAVSIKNVTGSSNLGPTLKNVSHGVRPTLGLLRASLSAVEAIGVSDRNVLVEIPCILQQY